MRGGYWNKAGRGPREESAKISGLPEGRGIVEDHVTVYNEEAREKGEKAEMGKGVAMMIMGCREGFGRRNNEDRGRERGHRK